MAIMGEHKTVREILVELNPDRTSIWRARVDELNLVVAGGTVAAAEAAAITAVMGAGAQLADDLLMRVRYGTRAQRLAAGWVPTARQSVDHALTDGAGHWGAEVERG